MALIQEVELVCRGYKISYPLPPITRIEEQSQSKRCARLRRPLQRTFSSLPTSYYRAYQEMKSLAVEADLEKYYDIYDINHADMLDLERANGTEPFEVGEDTLKAFKVGLQKLHLARKLFFCSLLALGVDGTNIDQTKWSAVARTLDALSAETGEITTIFDGILGAEEDIQLSTTPKMPLTPGRERLRSQMKKLNSLSQGSRGVQAIVHLLREDAENSTVNALQSSRTAAERYDSIGNELRDLIEEWEEGRSLFKDSIEGRDHHLPLPILSRTAPSSPTMSLGGSTAVEGSPPDALRALQGSGSYHRSSSSTATSSAGEEVFEAIALPRQRSTLSREERIAKMKEDRVRQAMARSKAEASSHMLKELETVIKLRPRGRTTGRISSI
ncbi:MAG: hypothetical protein Q9222_000850 [Ikaeria aurantiellina]